MYEMEQRYALCSLQSDRISQR